MEKVIVKIQGLDEHALRRVADRIANIYPFSIVSKIIPNDRDAGYHCIMTIIEAE